MTPATLSSPVMRFVGSMIDHRLARAELPGELEDLLRQRASSWRFWWSSSCTAPFLIGKDVHAFCCRGAA
jgi:hypothetical protein